MNENPSSFHFFCCKQEVHREKHYKALPTGMKQRDSTEITVSPLTTFPKQEDKSFAQRNLHYHRGRK